MSSRATTHEKYGERIEDADESIVPVHTEAECETRDDIGGSRRLHTGTLSATRH
jgi:hypothetical protein